MTVSRALTFIACLFSTALASAEDDSLPFGNTEACMQGPLAEFGQYIGDWKIEDSTLAQDGSGWTDGDGARWIFTCLGNGTAIQDFWLPADGKVGTNLRTWNTETESWDIAWTVMGIKGFAHIQARKDSNDDIVMHYKSPAFFPRLIPGAI